MILEAAVLNVRAGQEKEQGFEDTFGQGQPLIVRWETVSDHTVGFRGSDEYQEWTRLLHPHHDPFPTVEHFEHVT